ncbi:MAG: ATP-grasp domain-containing protein [Pseudomonadales bacterium]
MKPVLVVGAGQLGLMMAAAGARFGIPVDRLDHVTGELVPGTSDLRLQISLKEIEKRYSVITAELEHLGDTELLNNIKATSSWCNATAFEILPTREKQKQMLDELGVSSAPWQFLAEKADLAKAHATLGDKLVVKSIRNGYDGKGQWRPVAGQATDIPDEIYGELIAEAMVDFSREVSLVGARFASGEYYFFPLTENYHHEGILRYSLGPAPKTSAMQSQAEAMLRAIMEHLDYVGVMAMECFETEQGLMINELAPRVHNSGHWTQAGSDYSQFDLHLSALTGAAAPHQPEGFPVTVMLNLIGCEWNREWQALSGIQCYWYGKERRDNRKLGHINLSAATGAELVRNCEGLMPYLDEEHRGFLAEAIALIQAP